MSVRVDHREGSESEATLNVVSAEASEGQGRLGCVTDQELGLPQVTSL
jgi:Family of unknown function (DUF5681)